MIPRGVEVFVGVEPIDLRWRFDRLSGAAEECMSRSARTVRSSCSSASDAIKIVFFDGSGTCQFYKRLDKGTFRMPEVGANATHPEIEERALDDLLDGIDLGTESAAARARREPVVH